MKAPNTLLLVIVILGSVITNPASAVCAASGLQLQVLGSGGPGVASGRASSAYLLWLQGRSRILLDAGGGTKNLFHQAEASLGDIDLIAMSHFHPDHAAELPAILWPDGGEFLLAGPDGTEMFPSVARYGELLFEPGGAYAILGGRVNYTTTEVVTDGVTVTPVWQDDGLTVAGVGVPHGDVPTVAYRVDSGELSIAFSSDQNGSNTGFIDFIRDVDYLVIHLAGSEDATGVIAELHAKPSVWGQMASAANAGHVIVSHISTSDPTVLEQSLAILAANYGGPITVAEDLLCIDLR